MSIDCLFLVGVRGEDLFQDISFWEQACSAVAKGFKGAENAYTPHKFQISALVEYLLNASVLLARFIVLLCGRTTSSV